MSEDELKADILRLGTLATASIALAQAAIGALKSADLLDDAVIANLHLSLSAAGKNLAPSDPAFETIRLCRETLGSPRTN